jgi:arsenate reductase
MEKMDQKIVVYHNPRCSKSRCALDFLNAHKLDFKVIEYLKDVPSKAELQAIITQLGIEPEALIRKGRKITSNISRGNLYPTMNGLKQCCNFRNLLSAQS